MRARSAGPSLELEAALPIRDRPPMDRDLGAVLRQVAKTAVLCAALGLLLYGVVAMVAAWPGGRWLLGLLLAAPLAALIGHQVIDAYRSGIFPQRGGAARRDTQPLAFWFAMAWFTACGLLLGILAAWCGLALIDDP
jgi:hypothetical protein